MNLKIGNPDSLDFDKLYREFYKRSFLFARSYVHDEMVAEDIASESLIKLWEVSRSKDIGNPQATLFIILKNKALDYLKHEAVKQKRLASLSDLGKRELEIRISTLEANTPEKIFAQDIQSIIDRTVSSLPDQTRLVFTMNRYQGFSKKEIAETVGITVKGVEYHLARALGMLKGALKDYLEFV